MVFGCLWPLEGGGGGGKDTCVATGRVVCGKICMEGVGFETMATR